MPPDNKASTKPVKRTSWLRSMSLPIAFITIGLVLTLLFGYLQTTVVTGTEFDTGTWSIRTFWYRRDPFSGRQLTGILHELPTSLSDTKNFPNSYFVGKNDAPPRWDLVKLQSGAAFTEGPAFVVSSYFEGYRAQQFWTTWSSANTVKANTLFSAARDLVDLGLYVKLPKLMELANVESTDNEFNDMINEQMREILTNYAAQRSADQDPGQNAEQVTGDLSRIETLISKYSTSK